MSTLELLVAFAVLTFTLTAAVTLVYGGQSAALDEQVNIEAIAKAQAVLEEHRALARKDFASLAATEGPDDIYTKGLSIQTLDSASKRLTSYANWSLGGRSLSVPLSTIVVDWEHPAAKCSPVLSGDWTEPKVYGWVDFSSPDGGSDVYVGGSKVWITSNPSSSVQDDFYVVDVSDPNINGLPEVGRFSTSYGLTSLAIDGSYAFVTVASAAYQVFSIDVLDYTSLDPSDIKSKLDLTVSGDTAEGNTLTYDEENKRLYVGLTASDGKEFRIIDASFPTALNEIGSGYEIGAKVNQIVLKDGLAYLATASTTANLVVLDVSTPSNPTLEFAGYPQAVISGQSLVFDPNSSTLYFGRAGGNANPKLIALDTDDLSTPKWTHDMDSNDGVFTMTLRENLLFMTTSKPNDGLQIWDVSDQDGPPVDYDTSPLNIQQGSTAGSDCSGNLLYIGQRSGHAMQIIGPS